MNSRNGAIPSVPLLFASERDVEFSNDRDRRLAVVKFEGSVGVQEIAKYAESLVAHPDFDPSFSEFTDLRGVQQFDLQANDFLTLADRVDPFLLAAKRAFVMQTSLQNRAACMPKFLRPHRTIEIFESVAQAEEWPGP